MRTILFSAQPYDHLYLDPAARKAGHELTYVEARLDASTARLAEGYPCASAFVHDRLDAAAIEQLTTRGVRAIVLRCAGFNNVDLEAADRFGLIVARVPYYSPFAVAEHAVGLMLTLNRKIHKAYNRVRENNYSLDGLLGFDLHGRTVGIVGTGAIGQATARILNGFGCKLLFVDPQPNDVCKLLGTYVPFEELLERADVVSLHCPLTPSTHYLFNEQAFARMRPGAYLVNTSRGALVDTAAAINTLKARRLGGLALDVYEEEEGLFFQDRSGQILDDDLFARLLSFNNVLVTAHQAFFTHEALEAIAATTMRNLTQIERGEPVANRIVYHR
jgi:D-lactate dehydrogenase